MLSDKANAQLAEVRMRFGSMEEEHQRQELLAALDSALASRGTQSRNMADAAELYFTALRQVREQIESKGQAGLAPSPLPSTLLEVDRIMRGFGEDPLRLPPAKPDDGSKDKPN